MSHAIFMFFVTLGVAVGFAGGLCVGWKEWGRDTTRIRRVMADRWHAEGFRRGYNARERELQRARLGVDRGE